MRTAVTLLGLLLSSTGSVSAQDEPAGKTGLKVGQTAPEFSLKDQAGKERKLSEFLKDDGVVAIVFYRSAGW